MTDGVELKGMIPLQTCSFSSRSSCDKDSGLWAFTVILKHLPNKQSHSASKGFRFYLGIFFQRAWY